MGKPLKWPMATTPNQLTHRAPQEGSAASKQLLTRASPPAPANAKRPPAASPKRENPRPLKSAMKRRGDWRGGIAAEIIAA